MINVSFLLTGLFKADWPSGDCTKYWIKMALYTPLLIRKCLATNYSHGEILGVVQGKEEVPWVTSLSLCIFFTKPLLHKPLGVGREEEGDTYHPNYS